jgi:hypothetical protein
MSVTLAGVEAQLKARAANLGSFTATGSVNRMRYAILRGLQTLRNLRDWKWLNQTATLTTTAGNLGPYDAPESFMRFAAQQQTSLFGFVQKDLIGPILATDSHIYTPYFRIEDGKILFFDDPGDGDLTLNYVAEANNDITEGALGASVAAVPTGLEPALMDYAMADLLRYLPNGAGLIQPMLQSARSLAEDYWQQEFMGTVQRGIHPRGLNKELMDSHAQLPSIDFGGRRR